MIGTVACVLSWVVAPMHSNSVAPRRVGCRMEASSGGAFRTPKSTDTAAIEQAKRATAAGLSPKEYEEFTRQTANEYLATRGAHVGEASAQGGTQRVDFLKQLWGVDSIPAVPAEAAADEAHVLATVYEIGGPLTGILSTSVAKQLPLIPHVGTCSRGRRLPTPEPCRMRHRCVGGTHARQASACTASSTFTRTTSSTAPSPSWRRCSASGRRSLSTSGRAL
jgi:hypothetical protein